MNWTNSPVFVGIALGSNLGDSSAELDAGIAYLRELSIGQKVRESARIQTLPVDCPPGSNLFLNSVAEIQVEITPRELSSRLQAFERSRGRLAERTVNAPRFLDLDLIYFGNEIIQESDLVIPHPRTTQRRFVLEPLAQLHPDLVLPGQTKSVQQLLDLLKD